ncbi:MAG: class I SAM-dependent methyltransferase [Saprospiraceae bacterium]|nr:class I SAM-dependent methyltransferase [Saprospiraceae bacterium]
MSLKHLLPTFRNRYRFVLQQVQKLAANGRCNHMLNLGTGEGDYDEALARYTKLLTALDINRADINLAKEINKHVVNLEYAVRDALHTGYADGSFDVVVCTEVIEHVGDPEALLKEIHRVLKPGGSCVMTFPSLNFPVTYDPVNFMARRLKMATPLIHQGAFAFGHDYLIDPNAFYAQVRTQSFAIKEDMPLGGHLVGLLEMYWTGWVQALIKSNKGNLAESRDGVLTIKPGSGRVPWMSIITDFILSLDRNLFTVKRYSIGRGIVLMKA